MKKANARGLTARAKRTLATGIARGAGGTVRRAAAAGGKGHAGGADTGVPSKSRPPDAQRARGGVTDTPEFCDFDCPHASFSSPDASGACRRDQAVWCSLISRYNNKNARCLAGPRPRRQ